MEEIEFRIKEILGRTALDNDMEVPEDVQKLARTTRYLATQLFLVCANEVGEKEIANPILKNAVDILK